MRLATLTLLAVLIACAPLSRADDIDLLSMSGGGVEPNVLILLDTSGSMDDEVDGERKMDLAKDVVQLLLTNTTGVRFGVMIFREHGGNLIAPIGTDLATMVATVAATDVTSGSGTPLGDQLYDAGLYFKGQFGHPSPIEQVCQANFIIIVTDGMQTQSNREVVDEATLRHTQDHSSALANLQNIVVHTVGFDLNKDDDPDAIDTLEDTAENGGGSSLLAANAGELTTSLTAVLNQVAAGTYSFTGPVLPTTSVTGSTRVYIASFETGGSSPVWRGFMRAYAKTANGLTTLDADGLPASTALAWDAAAQLATRNPGTRTIYTVIGGTRRAFARSNGLLTAAMLGVGSSTERDKLIDFVRGVDTYDHDEDGQTNDQRPSILGSILHSTPVLISPPFVPTTDPDYVAFQQAQAGRTRVLLVGANDGMLHAFRESDGVELWGWVPPDLLPRLKEMTPEVGAHPYYVDGSPVAADVELGGTYKTIVVFGERRGGRRYHAIDVTDPTNPQPLWSFTDTRLGETWSDPVIGKVRLAGNDEASVAFIGGGYDTANNNSTGKLILAIDLETGQKLWEYRNDGTGADRALMNFSLAATPAAIDLDRDGFIDRLYAGDVGGQLWKFNVSAPATLSGGLVDNWTGKRLFAASPGQTNPPAAGEYLPAQSIYFPPAVALDEDRVPWLHFGTGDRNRPKSTSGNRFYAIRDDTDMTNGSALDEGDLQDVTSTTAAAPDGWYVRLAAGEKVLGRADLFDGTVYFSSFTPGTTGACSAGGGTARLYAVQMDTGYAALDWATGEPLDPTDSSEPRGTDVGTGIPGGPSMVIALNDGIMTTTVLAPTTDEQLAAVDAPSPLVRRLLYWREAY